MELHIGHKVVPVIGKYEMVLEFNGQIDKASLKAMKTLTLSLNQTTIKATFSAVLG